MVASVSFDEAPRSVRSEGLYARGPVSTRTRRRLVRAPEVTAVASAPMRVSFAGGGSDLPPFVHGLGGRIVGAALDLRTRVLVEPFDKGWVRLELGAQGDKVTTRRSDSAINTEIAFRLLEVALLETHVTDGVRVRVETDVAPGAGLGGSATAAVATLCALRASIGEPIAPAALANAAMLIERDGLRLACGLQDQIFASFGGLLDLRFDESGKCVARDPVAASPDVVAEFERGVLLVDTSIRRVSGDVIGRVTDDVMRATAAELVAAAGDVARGFEIGSLTMILDGMRRNSAAKCRRDPIACATAAELERKLTPVGAEVVRACGAGAGGHILVWAKPESHAAIVRALRSTIVRRPAIDAPGVRVESI